MNIDEEGANMESKPMAPFSTYPERTCDNPDCKKGKGGKPRVYSPKSPWQRTCCDECRNRRNYLDRKAKRAMETPGPAAPPENAAP